MPGQDNQLGKDHLPAYICIYALRFAHAGAPDTTLCIQFYWPRKTDLQFWPTMLPMSLQASRRAAVVRTPAGVMLLQLLMNDIKH